MDDLDGFQPIKPFNNREHLTSRHRLRGFDYTNPGYYFVTVCTHRRQLLFGECTTGEMRLSPAGSLMHALLANRPESAEVSIDAFVVMPNHVHILFYLSLDNVENTISSEMKWFKGVGRSQYAAGVRAGVLAPYREKLWQQGFNDEIIRDDRHLDAVRLYIAENPNVGNPTSTCRRPAFHMRAAHANP